MPYGYLGQNQPNQTVSNSGVFSITDVAELQSQGKLGGSLELIAEETVSGVSSVDFLTIYEDVFDVHYLQISNYQTSDTGSGAAWIRFYESGVLETAAVYQLAAQRGDSNAAFGVEQSTAATNLLQFRNFGAADSNASAGGYSYFYNLGNSSKYSFQTFHSSYLDNSSNSEFTFGGGVLPQASVVDGISFFPTAGTMSGTLKLYGVKQI